MTALAAFAEIAALDHGLCVLSSVRSDGTISASVVNAGVLPHPITGEAVVGLVARGLRKLDHVRADPAIDAEGLRVLLRDVFVAAGGTHDDWDAYDRTLADERSAAVLITARRTYPRAG